MSSHLLSAVRRLFKIPHGDTPNKFFLNDGKLEDELLEYSKIFRSVNHGVIKWAHYPSIYESLFMHLRNKENLRLLEIGVQFGGSLELLREYFHSSSIIFGIDIDPRCNILNEEGFNVRIGSQSDERFLSSVVKEMGGLDIVIDDGSHNSRHQKISFERLFPLLNEGGLYVVEDVEHSYFRNQSGFPFLPSTFMNRAKRSTEELNKHFRTYNKWGQLKGIQDNLWSITFYSSVIVFEKRQRKFPKVLRQGKHAWT